MDNKNQKFIRYQNRPYIISQPINEKQAIVPSQEVSLNVKNVKQPASLVEQEILKKSQIASKPISSPVNRKPRKDPLAEHIKNKNLFKKKKRKLKELTKRKRALIDLQQIMEHPVLLKCFGLRRNDDAHIGGGGIGCSDVAESVKNNKVKLGKVRSISQDQSYQEKRNQEKRNQGGRKRSNPDTQSEFSQFAFIQPLKSKYLNEPPFRASQTSDINYLQLVQRPNKLTNQFSFEDSSPNYLESIEEQQDQSFSRGEGEKKRFNYL